MPPEALSPEREELLEALEGPVELAFRIMAEPFSNFVGIMTELAELGARMVARTTAETVVGLESVAGKQLAAAGSIVRALVEAVIGYSIQLRTAMAVIVRPSVSSFDRSIAFIVLIVLIVIGPSYSLN